MSDHIPVPQPPLTPEQIAAGKDVEIRRLNDQLEAQSVTYMDNLTEIQMLKHQLTALTQECEAYRSGGITEALLRKGDGFLKIGTGCTVVRSDEWASLTQSHQQAVEALEDMKDEVADCIDELQDEVLYPMNEGKMNPVKLDVCLTQLTQAIEAIHSKALATHKEKG